MNLIKRVPVAVWAMALILVPMAIQVAMKWMSLPLADGTIIGPQDPDPWLRLTLVRDWLQGGSWYNHIVANSNAPFGGIASPWTRPLDLVIAFFTTIQPESVELNIRLIRAALLMPLLWMALLLIGIYRNVKILTPLPAAAFMVAVLVASCVPMWNYFNSGNADHHSLLAVVFVWALAGVLTPNPSPRLTIFTGTLFALQLWISPEAILLIGGMYGWYGLLWLTGDARAKPWALLATTITAASAVMLMIERPQTEWLTPLYDSISIVYVLLLALVASAVWLLEAVRVHSVFARGCLAAGCVAIITGLSLHAFPLLLQGPLAGSDPFIHERFMKRIVEAQSLFTTHPLHVLAMLIQPILAIGVLYFAKRDGKSIFSAYHIALLSYLLLITGTLYLTQQRFYYYFYPVVVVVLAPFFAALFMPGDAEVQKLWPSRLLAHLPAEKQMTRRLPLIVLAVGLPLLLLNFEPKGDTYKSRAIDACLSAARRIIYNGELARIGNGKPLNLFVSTDLGGEVLFWTPHRIIASNYHREAAGIQYVWDADAITDLNVLRRTLAKRKINALMLCPVVKAAERSALQRLRQGILHAGWLRRVPYTLPQAPSANNLEAINKPVIFLVN